MAAVALLFLLAHGAPRLAPRLGASRRPSTSQLDAVASAFSGLDGVGATDGRQLRESIGGLSTAVMEAERNTAGGGVRWGRSPGAFVSTTRQEKVEALLVERLMSEHQAMELQARLGGGGGGGDASSSGDTPRRLAGRVAVSRPQREVPAPAAVRFDFEAARTRARQLAQRCEPAGDAQNPALGMWKAHNATAWKESSGINICAIGFLFKCSDTPHCWGECDRTDPNLYYRCYRKKTCIDAACKCMCGPAWTTHEACDPNVATGVKPGDPTACGPTREYPRRFAGCCCEPCECAKDRASNRVDGCCSCQACPGINPNTGSFWYTDGNEMQCLWVDGAVGVAPSWWLAAFATIAVHLASTQW